MDDIDVNLSDYEEEGDSDDERQKAYKKKKYGLKDEVEADSDGERPSKVTQTQRLQTQQPQSVTNYTDGLVQASVYYEPPEEEAQVVEKILGLRTRPSRVRVAVYTCVYVPTMVCTVRTYVPTMVCTVRTYVPTMVCTVPTYIPTIVYTVCTCYSMYCMYLLWCVLYVPTMVCTVCTYYGVYCRYVHTVRTYGYSNLLQ